ncbi:peptide ABC transporter permease [Candidatus Bathyarchaeota archaeon]|nr:MAG: peptide ABC transporter permease [Candidatus Bathyarchaeota archaeon]
MKITSPTASTLKKLKENKAALFGFAIVLFFITLVIFADIIAPYDPNEVFRARQPPSSKHWFGTDTRGRDVFSLVVYGARTTFYVGACCCLIEFVISFIIGGVSGYIGGWLDEALMRIADIFLALPSFIMVILAVSMFKARSLSIIILVMALIDWPYMTRVIRSQVLQMKNAPFVEAARAMGASTPRILFRHILPNIILPVIVLSTIHFAGYVLWEASLSFLGLGDPNSISYGAIILSGKNTLQTCPWISFFPGIFLFLLLLGFQLFGDGLRDIFEIRV